MQTTLYFANNQLQILQGDYKNHALTVEKYLRVPMTPGGLINGVITNEAILLDALNRASSDYDVDFKNTSLVINTSLAIYKNIQVPKLKPAELEELCSHEFEDAPNYEDLVMDYKGIPGHDGGTNMFAVAIEKGVLESYTALFEAAGIKLKRIDTALSAMVDYTNQTADYQDQSYSIYVMDGNNLLYALFENGKYVFSSQSRLMSERNTESLTIELNGKISSLSQFNKSQKSGFTMDQAYFAGVSPEEVQSLVTYTEGTDVHCALLPTTSNILEKHVIDDEFYLDDGFLVAAGSFETKDAIDLNRAYKRKMHPRKGITLKNKTAILPLVLLGIFVVTLLGFTVTNLIIQKQINTINQYINDEANQAQYTKAKDVEANLASVQAETKAYDDNGAAVNTYPTFNGDKIYQIMNSGDGITTTSITYDGTTGMLEYTGTASNEYQAAAYVDTMINTGLFKTVEYLGYSYSAGTSATASGTTGNTATTPTAPSYSFTYKAQLKGGVGQQ